MIAYILVNPSAWKPIAIYGSVNSQAFRMVCSTREMATVEVRILSCCTVRPSPRKQGDDRERQRRCHLTPWDLKLIALGYLQKGILLPKPPNQQEEGTHPIIARLKSSLSLTLDHFFPLSGRLATTKHDSSPPSLSVFIDCNDEGIEFVHAITAVTVSDVLAPLVVPRVVESFFPLNGAMNLDAHSIPLLAIQVTELIDGIFIGCSLNHAAGDGFTFWNFLNSWSEISRTGAPHISRPPVTDRWFPESCAPPLRLPLGDLRDLVKSDATPPPRSLSECFFHFSSESIAKLKAKANVEMNTERISSLQSLLAQVWRCVTRARDLKPHEETGYGLALGHRSRLKPPLPPAYLGNALLVSDPVNASAGDVLGRGLGWVAWQLNQTVASQTDAWIRDWLKSWAENPTFSILGGFKPCNLFTGSSPWFDVYGNDFGWGRPLTVRSGGTNKFDGKVTVFTGPEKGTMDLEICLSFQTLSRLVEDKEFMEVLGRT